MSNGSDPSIRDLIAEAHAARAAGDMDQVKRALDELQRVTDAASQPEQEESAAANPDLPARLIGGVTGAFKGVGDVMKGTALTGARALAAYSDPAQLPGLVQEVFKGGRELIPRIREVTQQYREGEASPEDVARTWTGGSAAILGPALAGLEAAGVDASPQMSLMDPVRAGGRTIAQALRRTEDVVSPRTALYRLRLKQARAAEAAGKPMVGSMTPDEQSGGEAVGTEQEQALAKHFGRPVSEFRGRVQARGASSVAPSAPEAQPISRGPPGTGMKAQTAPQGRTLPYYPRGGQLEQAVPPPPVESPRVPGPASPAAAARRAPYAELRRVLQEPATPGRIKNIILTELQRRGIVGEGLLPPP